MKDFLLFNKIYIYYMKKEYIISIMCFSIIIFLGCNKKKTKNTYIDSENVVSISISNFEKVFYDTAYFKKPQIIVLETNEESFLSEIKRISYDDNILFIFDKSLMKISFFDVTGKYINSIDRRGNGPEEYIQISDFAIDTSKKQIILLCDIPNKLMYFDYTGTFIQEKKLDTYYSELMVDHDYIYFEKMNNIESKGFQIAIFNKNTEEWQETIDLIDIKNTLFISGNSLSKGTKMSYARRFDNSIYEINEGRIMKKYNIDFKKHSFPKRLIEEESSSIVLGESSQNKYIFSLASVLNTEHYILFKTNLGLFIYDKKNDILNASEQIMDSNLGTYFSNYILLENTDKVVCAIEDPTYIKHAAKRIPEEKKNDERFQLVLDIANKLTEENNPVLFIYEFKD